MHVRTNMLIQRFRKCSQHVKVLIKLVLVLVKRYWYLGLTVSVCMVCAQWLRFSSCIMTKFKYCYNKCMKKFFGYAKYYSVTEMLLTLRLPSFDTVNIRSPSCVFGTSIAMIWWNYFDVFVRQHFYEFYCVLLYIMYCIFSSFTLSVCMCVCLLFMIMGHVAWFK